MKEQYISYSAIQLASEDSFIAWVMHGAYTREWEEWLRQHTHVQEKSAQARQLVVDMMQLPQSLMSADEEKTLWNKISNDISITVPDQTRKTSGTKVIRWMTVAAAAVVALFIWFGTRSNQTTIVAQAGEHPSIQLPESSRIQLNAGSNIVYNKKRFTKDRELKLVGEAFFEVHPGSRFTVNTPQGSVTVLGTSFNVIAWPDRFEVTCYTGKVKVENQNRDQHTITPGERCQNVEGLGKLSTSSFTLKTDKPEWTHGKFVFDNQPLKIVVEELERQYNITVKLQSGLEDLPYVGFFESGDLDEALDFITWPKHLKAEKQGNTVLIGR
ncbi:MAG TPA: FecR domain-containing protein [Saprospiraceae bacterium]|nr:FecR domain-containing protein [Saprospiraceae bacterium]